MPAFLQIDPSRCTACRLCELACSFEKFREFNPEKSCIREVVLLEEAFYIPVVCYQCDEAWCMKVCPSVALTRNRELGIIELNETRCTGCRMCTMACPFGVMFYSPEKGKVFKCDLCRGNPACARICPTKAIEYREEDLTLQRKRKIYSMKLMDAYREVQR